MSASYILVGFLQWIAGNFFVLLFSLFLWSHLRLHRPYIDCALLLFYVLFNTSLFVLAMGLIGMLERNIMAGVSIASSVLLFLFFRIPIASSVQKIRNDLTDVWKSCVHHPYLTAGFVVVALLVGLRMLAHVWILSPYIWDTMSYQLPKVAEWVQYQKLAALATPVARSFWPANFELFQTWFVLFFHHDFLIEAAGLPFYLLAIAGVYSCGRSLDFSVRWSAFLSLIFALTPAVLMNAVSCKNDIAVTSIYLFILALLLDYRRNGDRLFEHFVLIAAGFLLALGTKPTIVFVLPGLCLIGFWCIWGRTVVSPETEVRRNTLTAAGFVLTASLLLGIYWYARNYAMFDNPFHPTDFRIAGNLVFGDGHGEGQQGAFKWDSLLLNFQDLIEKKIFDRGEPYTADLGNMTGWGWFIFSCGLAAGLPALIMRADFRWLTAGFLLSLASLFGFVQPDPWNMRFASWFPALFIMGFGIVASRMKRPIIRRSLIFLAVTSSLLNFMACISPGYMSPGEWKAGAATSVWKRAVIPDDLADALRRIPPGETLACFTHGTAQVYPLYGPDYSRKINYLERKRDMDPVAEMKRTGVRYLLFLDVNGAWSRYMDSYVGKGLLKHIKNNLYCLTEGFSHEGR